MKKVIIDQAGPLPISVQVEGIGDIPVIFTISGSCYTNTNTGMTGINLEIDGSQVAQSIIYANNLNVHLATVTKAYETNLDTDNGVPKTHTIQLSNLPNTVTDGNDWFTVTMHV
ncbi:MAG: hypothetical protein P1U56_12770 [Saprospiraceae bacterium]|nr:hypothetical protein [Saprospiraceae bacterium]